MTMILSRRAPGCQFTAVTGPSTGVERQPENDRRARAVALRQLDRAVVAVHDRPAECQPQTGAGDGPIAYLAAPVEPAEQLLPFLRRHADAGVRHDQLGGTTRGPQ